MRPFLFMAGEFAVTQPAVFRRDRWSHTMTAKKLERDGFGGVHRPNVREDLKGFVYFNRAENYAFELHNLETIRASGRPCWPDVTRLQALSSRHATLHQCLCAGLIDHDVWFLDHESLLRELVTVLGKIPLVLKVGESHCGEGKFLLHSKENIPEFEGIGTLEPFFEGESCRILVIGDRHFGVKYWNDNSWIKNSAGADMAVWPDPPEALVGHARRAADAMNLEIAGVDYIIEKSGKFHFLEINQYPGLNISDESAECARKFLDTKMQWVEEQEDR